MTENPGPASSELLRPELDEAREKLVETVDELAAKMDVKVHAKEPTISNRAAAQA